jgi:hypothetical protein
MNSRKIKTPQIKLEKTQKQLNELREDFNKFQSETKETIKKEIYERKKITQVMEEEFNKDMENLRKKNQIETLEIKSLLNQIKYTRESHSSRLEQAEVRISELEHGIATKEETEELLEASKAAKRIHKYSVTPSKDQTCESWALKKEKSCKTKVYIIYSTNNSRKFHKS